MRTAIRPTRTRGIRSICRAAWSLLLLLLLLLPACAAEPQETEDSVSVIRLTLESSISVEDDEQPSDINKQTAEEALAQDLELVATAKRWTPEQAAADRRAADAVGRAAEELFIQRPDIFIGSAVSDIPGDPPTLYVKGPADAFVRALAGRSEVPIRIADNQPFSFSELEERQLRVHRALQGIGVQALTEFRLDGGGAIVAIIADSMDLKIAEISAAIPVDLQGFVDISFADAAGFKKQNMFGGMEAWSGSSRACTTGWAVRDNSGVEGVSTAGHCNNIDLIVEPGVGNEGAFMYIQHDGNWGDVEMLVENDGDYSQLDDFYSDAFNVRDTSAVETWANMSVGESVCVYGRATNARFCMDIESVSVACMDNGRLVRMDAGPTLDGDSGGGFSWQTRAYGSHVGLCASRSVFSVADLYDEALAPNGTNIGVHVMIQP